MPRSDPDKVDVNVHCLDHVDVARLDVEAFDGARWDEAIASAGWKSDGGG